VLDREDCSPFVPREILDLPVRAEFRNVCPVFLSFEEPTEEPSLRAFIGELLISSDRYGGYLHQVEFGDKGGMAILLFGAPSAQEHRAERAVSFVLALREQRTGVRWRCGITQGVAWAGIRGNENRCEYAVIGDIVNLAARLGMRAQWDTVWVSHSIFERLRDSFRFNKVGELEIRGKRQPHLAYTFHDKKLRCVAPHYHQPMVGRDRELSTIESFMAPLMENRFAGILHVYGEAGIGKSRLMHELRCRLHDKQNVAWFTCPADPILRQSLNPFRHFLREYFEIAGNHSSDTRKRRFSSAIDSLRFSLQTLPLSRLGSSDLMGELERTRPFLGAYLDLEWEGSLYENLEPRLRLENMHAAMKTFVKAESLRHPFVLHLEDAHWLDEDSQELLRHLVRNVEHYPFGIVCTGRYHDDGRCARFEIDESVRQETVRLDTLDSAGIRAVCDQLLPGTPTDSLVTFLTEKTEGNPFFLEQLLLDLTERNALGKTSSARLSLKETAGHVPTKIDAVLVARLDRLAARVKSVVQTAAVLGNEFELQVLSLMLPGEPDVADRVNEAQLQQIWSAVNEMRYLFHHALMRDAAYEMQLQTHRESLHRRAAEAMERIHESELSAHYADLAHHWGQAGDRKRAYKYAKAAGERAVARHALDEAMHQFSTALTLIPENDTDELFSLLLAREQVASLQGSRDVQTRDLDRLEAVARTLGDIKRQVEVAIRRAHFFEATGDFAAAISVARDAIGLAQTCRDGGKEAAGYRLWGGALLQQGDYENARGQLDRARLLSRRAEDQKEETTVLLNLGTVSTRLGDYRDAQSWYEEALRLARKRNDHAAEGLILNNLGSALYHSGDHESAQTYFRESLRICREIGYRLAECNALGNLATISADRGDYAASRSDYEEALRLRREIGDRQGESLTLNNLGKIAYDVGEYRNAQSYLRRALQLARQINARPIEGAVHVNLSAFSHVIGDNTEALEHGDAALRLAEELGDLRMMAYAHISRGNALIDLGRTTAASEAYETSASIRQQLGHEVLALEALGGLARIALQQGDHEAAIAHVDQILDHLESGSLEGASEPFAVYLTCYRVLVAQHDHRAPELLAKSVEQLRQQAARIGDESLRASFLSNVAAHAELARLFETMKGG
jgi:tetratricopeptide (TPR) repeat protein